MAEVLKVGDLVRLVAGERLMAVHSVDRTPNGTVMIGCARIDQPSVSRIRPPFERRPTIH